MSAETMEWLNSMTLIGFTLKRGEAWHYRSDLQADEPNHYPGEIPVDDVLRRLFNFDVLEQPIYIVVERGGKNVREEIPGRKAMVTSDDNSVLGIFKEGYQGHSYKEWLLDNVSNILGDNLSIGSAGLLRNRGQAWVSVEMPDNITTPEGVEFRPHLLATTSFDGTLATTYKRCCQLVVCDNTRDMALSEKGQQIKVKHSKYSLLKIGDAKEALAIVHTMADDFAKEIETLCKWKVSDKQFNSHLDLVVPVPDDDGRGKTVAENKRAEIINLYNNDERAAMWNGNAFGVLQAHNTWVHHYAQVRKGAPRVIRNMENVVKDKFAAFDSDILMKLATVTDKKIAIA